ncbi:hypothetical protein QQ008_03705 [Fulvivirgaceae bacterium BMA10]|uniref:Uncharacterized protein n=1 Tax=Splendidivirga corallicola TaxID=3051826 RepID=A0ABT8KJK5_9BACT|nr:hypothetical protein [Fulvivirgaceae bacterium BMA10]
MINIIYISLRLGPVAMVYFLTGLLFVDPLELNHLVKDIIPIFFLGSIICTCISFFASLVTYLPIIQLEEGKAKNELILFKKYLPFFVLIMTCLPITFLSLNWENLRSHILVIPIFSSAYLTAITGWFWHTKRIVKNNIHR